jgi:hypothetical protein
VVGVSAFAQLSLDDALKSCKDSLIKELDKESSITKVKVAIDKFDTPSQVLSKYVIDYLSDHLVGASANNPRLEVVQRDNKVLEDIMRELEWQENMGVNEKNLQGTDDRLEANIVISGSFTYLGGDYQIGVQANYVKTLSILVKKTEKVKRDKALMKLLGEIEPTFRINIIHPYTTADIPAQFVQELESEITGILKICMAKNGYVEAAPSSNGDYAITVRVVDFKRYKPQRGYYFFTIIKIEASNFDFRETYKGTPKLSESSAFQALISSIVPDLDTKINNSLKNDGRY